VKEGTKQRVLVIDDSVAIHELLDVRFRSEEIELEHAFGPEEGLLRAVESLPDLVLLDVDMPEISGFEVCQRLKADPRTSHLPIIFLTAADQLYTKVQGFDLGAVDYVTKPFQGAELRARVRAALRTKRYLDLLASRAQVDGLTALWNRAHFDRRLAEDVAIAQRGGTPVGLVLLDVDHFKAINDKHGHPFGDVVLQRIAEIVSASVRDVDAACRFGGEEFACILLGTGADVAALVADRIRGRIAETIFTFDRQAIRVTASFGVAATDEGPTTPAQLISEADRALYAAKRGGRNCVRKKAA
jgi:two-component system, cell cycle response regulator